MERKSSSGGQSPIRTEAHVQRLTRSRRCRSKNFRVLLRDKIHAGGAVTAPAPRLSCLYLDRGTHWVAFPAPDGNRPGAACGGKIEPAQRVGIAFTARVALGAVDLRKWM